MRFVSIIPLIFVVSVSACAPTRMHATAPVMGHSGYADGSIEMVFEQPSFQWDDGSPKVVATATTSDGEIFSGRVVQHVENVETRREKPISRKGDKKEKGAWHWGWETTDIETETEASTRAEPTAQAVLVGNRGRSMKCTLHLTTPSDGVAGGGIGECMISDGTTVPLQF